MTVAVNGFGEGEGLQCDDTVEVAVVAVVLGDVEAAEHRAEGSLGDGAEQGGTAALELGHQLRGRELQGLLTLLRGTEETLEEILQRIRTVVLLVRALYLLLLFLRVVVALALLHLADQLGVELAVVNALNVDQPVGFQDKEPATRARSVPSRKE